MDSLYLCITGLVVFHIQRPGIEFRVYSQRKRFKSLARMEPAMTTTKIQSYGNPKVINATNCESRLDYHILYFLDEQLERLPFKRIK